MADSKVSELTSATSVGGGDVFYVVQSNTSKKVSANVLFQNISNPILSGNVSIGGTPQTLAAPGIVSVITPITHLSVDAVGGTLQIPQGVNGQVKVVTMTSSAGGTYTFAASNIAGNTTVSLDAVGDTVVLVYTDGKWFPISSTTAIDLTSIASNVIPSANNTFDLGSPTNQWNSLYVSNNTIFIGGTPLTIVNGELVVGSGEASANLATVAYVDAAVANVGGGGGDTGDIIFTNTTMTPPDQEDIILAAANSEVQITGEDFRVEVTDDIRLQASDLFSLRNISNADPITIITDYNDAAHEWRFGEDGSFQIPGDTTVAGQITGTSGTSTLVLAAEPDSNTSIQLNDAVDSIIRTVANLEIRTNVSDSDKTWVFDNTGVLTTPGNISLSYSGCTSSEINTVPNSSGDGAGKTTLELVPDITLKSSDRYVIIDPTAPTHVHVRAGGIIDNSNADLYLGGENSHFHVPVGLNPDVYIKANNYSWSFYNTGFSQEPTLTFADLPSPGSGQRAFISDANLIAQGNFGAVVGGGGANTIPVWSDFDNWYVG